MVVTYTDTNQVPDLVLKNLYLFSYLIFIKFKCSSTVICLKLACNGFIEKVRLTECKILKFHFTLFLYIPCRRFNSLHSEINFQINPITFLCPSGMKF